jgi:hypothetical protein
LLETSNRSNFSANSTLTFQLGLFPSGFCCKANQRVREN